jgi:hypothetical protein
MEEKKTSYTINQAELPEMFPTHAHPPEFWEALGRVVATFGLLEEVLGKAAVSFEATTPHTDAEFEEAYKKWLSKLDKCLTDQLWNLTTRYEKAVKNNPNSTIANLESLIAEIRKMTEYRNVLCHGSWRNPPDTNGATTPFFFNRKMERFDTPIDISALNEIQTHTASIICEVINTVTHMGWEFPGMNGPGEKIFKHHTERYQSA